MIQTCDLDQSNNRSNRIQTCDLGRSNCITLIYEVSPVPRLYLHIFTRTQTKVHEKRGKNWDISTRA